MIWPQGFTFLRLSLLEFGGFLVENFWDEDFLGIEWRSGIFQPSEPGSWILEYFERKEQNLSRRFFLSKNLFWEENSKGKSTESIIFKREGNLLNIDSAIWKAKIKENVNEWSGWFSIDLRREAY